MTFKDLSKKKKLEYIISVLDFIITFFHVNKIDYTDSHIPIVYFKENLFV